MTNNKTKPYFGSLNFHRAGDAYRVLFSGAVQLRCGASDALARARVGADVSLPDRGSLVHPGAHGLCSPPDRDCEYCECFRQRPDAINIDCRTASRSAPVGIWPRMPIDDEWPRRHLVRCRSRCAGKLRNGQPPALGARSKQKNRKRAERLGTKRFRRRDRLLSTFGNATSATRIPLAQPGSCQGKCPPCCCRDRAPGKTRAGRALVAIAEGRA